MAAFGDIYCGKRVLLTGHTGFKGTWLTFWLRQLGAEVIGLALDPITDPSLFDLTGAAEFVSDHRIDIRNRNDLDTIVSESKPDIIFHLAAQSTVLESYKAPVETYEINVMGTIYLLESVRKYCDNCAIVAVTSDKCYLNAEGGQVFSETDPMGGSDPYSSSKGAVELVVDSWRDSFFSNGSEVRLASARAGNVIGGGDWAPDRIMTDCIKALRADMQIGVRNPNSTRPWQHVLEPLGGYLLLGAKLLTPDGNNFATAWNFGPPTESVCTVREVVELVIKEWGGGSWEDLSNNDSPKEAKFLALSSKKALELLAWAPTWGLRESVSATAVWYRAWNDHATQNELREICCRQISEFQKSAQQ